jgi:uncharacterized YccA/Bax inhibitor family protein
LEQAAATTAPKEITMANPLLNERTADHAARTGWDAPDPSTRSTPLGMPSPLDTMGLPDDRVSPWVPGAGFTIGGTISAATVLMVILLASATAGWMAGGIGDSEVNGFPVWALVCIVAGFGLTVAVSRKPMLARVLAPIYAVVQGFFVGVISRAYETYQDGIVVQAIGATLAVTVTMFVLYRTRLIKVTERLRSVVMAATMGLMLFYGVSLLVRLVAGAGSVSYLSSAGPLGILLSVFAAGLAAFNLLLDFDTIERGTRAGWPKGMEWFAAFGLMVTIVWLYLELLRLLSKLQRD